MSVLTIKRVADLPALAEANTTYLIAVEGGNDLQVAVTNGDGSVVKKTLLRSEVATAISDAIAASETGSSADIAAAQAAAAAYTDAREISVRQTLDVFIENEIARSNAYADQAEADAITAAATYTDDKVSNEATERANGDLGVLASAKTYTDNAISAEVTRSNTYADNAVSAGIAALDLSATVQYAADIAARDTLAAGLTKSSLIFVVDATSDATVTVGSALYFYDTVGEAFTKVSEYESLDLVIPNKAILQSFSVVNSRLYLDGKPITTVDFDAAGSTW